MNKKAGKVLIIATVCCSFFVHSQIVFGAASQTQTDISLNQTIDSHQEYEYMLERAVWESDLERAKILLDKGANPNSSKIGIPLIHACVDNYNNEMLKLLFEYGADPNAFHVSKPTLGGCPTTFASYPHPSVFYFLPKDNIDSIKLFIEYGLDLGIRDNLFLTPLADTYERLERFSDNTGIADVFYLLLTAEQRESKYIPKEGDAKRPAKQPANSKYIYAVTDENLDYLQLTYSDITDNFKAGVYGGKYFDVRPFGINSVYPEDDPGKSFACVNIVNPLDRAYLEAAQRGQLVMEFRSPDAVAIYDRYENDWFIELTVILPESEKLPTITATQHDKPIDGLKLEKITSSDLYYTDEYDSYRITFSQKNIDVTENIVINTSNIDESFMFIFTPYYYGY